MTSDQIDAVERAKSERRLFVRVRMDQPGRLFLPSENREAPCQIVDLSPGGAQVVGEFVPPAETQVVLYVDGFGRFEGKVIQPGQGSFGVRFQCSDAKREKIAEQLTLYLNKDLVGDTLMRRHTPVNGLSRFTRANGDIVACEVLDLSVNGVSLKTATRPPVGEVVLIAQTAGRVVSQHEKGITLELFGTHAVKPVDHPVNPFTVVA